MDAVFAAELTRWWEAHREDVVSRLGFETALHVHACAARVAAANLQACKLASHTTPSDLEITALHSLALKYVADRERPFLYEIIGIWARMCGCKAALQMQECKFVVDARYHVAGRI